MRALLVLAVGIVIVAAQSENSKISEELRKKNAEAEKDPLIASASDNDKKVVTIKKHKNYEIVLYEYGDSGEENEESDNDENQNKAVNKKISFDNNSEGKIDSAVPIAWNPVKIPPPVVFATTTTTTTTRRPTTTTTTQRPTTTTTTPRPTTTTTTTQRPTTTTQRTTTTTPTTQRPASSVSAEDSEDYGVSDEANNVIRPLTKQSQPIQIRPFNPLQAQAKPKEESESGSSEESDENQSFVSAPTTTTTPKPKVKNVPTPKFNRKAENSADTSIPKVKVRKPVRSTTTTSTTTTTTTTPEPPPPPPPENIFYSHEESEEDIPLDAFQKTARQKGAKVAAARPPKKDSEEQVVSTSTTTQKPFKTKVKVFTPPPPFRNPHIGVVSVEEIPSFPPNKAPKQQKGKEKQVPQFDSGSSSEEDYSDSQTQKQKPHSPKEEAALKGILKPNYNIPQTNTRPNSQHSFTGVQHQQKNPNFKPHHNSDSSGDEYSTSSSDEDVLPNSRKPISRPGDIQRVPKPIGRPRTAPPSVNWKPNRPVGSPNKKDKFRPPSEVDPGEDDTNIQFIPPSEVTDENFPPRSHSSQESFRPPSEVQKGRLPPKKSNSEENHRFRPPSEVPNGKLPHFPRFNSSNRPSPARPFIPPSEVDSSSGSSSESVEEDESLICKDPTGKKGICQEYFKCSVLYSNMVGKINLQEYKCPLPTQVGICCPIVEKNAKSRKLMEMVNTKDMPINSQVSKLIKSNLPTSFAFGDNWVDEMEEIERELLAQSVTVKRNTPAFGHHRFFPTSKKIRDVSHIGFSLLQTSNDLSERLQLTNEVGGIGLKSFKSSNIEALTDRCPSEPFCPRRKYRTIDGTCNNLGKPKLGGSLTPLSRVLSPAYADGRWEPRRSVQGFDLPSPRLLSQQFIPDHDVPNTRFTLYTMQFGQFVDHDISSVPMFTFGNNSGIDCCQNGQFLPRHLVHPNCFPIEIPRDDPFYSRFGQRCMNLVRSRMAPRIDCSLGYADQMNALTHWLDASNVYGSNEEEGRELRSFNRGFLRFSTVPGSKIWLPLKPTGNSREIDYKAGDDRVNEMQGLMITHMVWFREHNRLADELSRLNPHWNDEQLYHEARRILIAEYQHIIYNEWLPIIIGRDYMDTYGILPLTRDYYKDYDSDVDSSVENSFSAAAFRMGHTLVQGVVRLVNQFGQNDEGVVISQHAENAIKTHAPGQVDKWIRGLVQQPVQNYDPFVTQHLNGRLFQGSNSQFGMDLSSLNIQRGRDHGIPGYNAYRELCQTGIKATSFDDFNDWIPREMIDKMKRFYVDVDDVDLWIGGLSETPLPGALIGPTFTCIIGDQFARSKKGDRYFYDIGDQPHSFTRSQLDEIRKASFARILCDNSDNLEAVQPSAFLLPDFDFNSLVDCERSNRIPRLDLRPWTNEPTP